MGTADQDDIGTDRTDEDGPAPGPTTPGGRSDAGGDSDPDAATGEEQAAENRDRESPS